MTDVTIRTITSADDAEIAKIIRDNLRAFHLDIPGTAYYDPELDCLSRFYNALPDKRTYFVATYGDKTVIGGIGVAEFTGFDN